MLPVLYSNEHIKARCSLKKNFLKHTKHLSMFQFNSKNQPGNWEFKRDISV